MRILYLLITAGLLLPFSLPGKDYVVVLPDGTITLNVRVDVSVTLAVDCDARTVEADLPFLPHGEYPAEIFSDGINADRHGEDYIHETVRMHLPGPVTLKMAPGGGWVARIKPAVN